MFTRMKGITSLAVFTAFLFSAPIVLAQKDAAKMSSADKQFVTTAASDSLAEVELGKLAQEKASRFHVRQFAQRMVQDHFKAHNQLMDLASRKGIAIPKELDPKHQQALDRLSKLPGAEFDQAYLDLLIKDHDKAVSDFEKQATSGEDQEIVDFAANELPTLKGHLDAAKTFSEAGREASRE